MDDRTIGSYLSRILSGYYVFVCNGRRFKIKYPDTNLKYEAEVVAQEEFENNKYASWIKEEEIFDFLKSFGMWTQEHEQFLEDAEKTADDLKVEIYKNFRNPSALKQFRKRLRSHEKTHTRILATKHSFDSFTLEGYCELVKNNHILSRSIYDENNRLFFIDGNNQSLFEMVAVTISKATLSNAEFREIARSPQWSYYWNAKKAGDLFGRSIVDWTDEQRLLVALSRMYDIIKEHPESPDEDIMNDDDALDGWSIFEKRKDEKERAKSRAEKMLPGNLKNSGEIFVMAHNRQEAKDIMSLNDTQSTAIIKERNQLLHKAVGKEIADANLPDVQRDIIINSNEKRMQHFRK